MTVTPKNPVQMGRKPKSSVLSIFVGYALAPLLLA